MKLGVRCACVFCCVSAVSWGSRAPYVYDVHAGRHACAPWSQAYRSAGLTPWVFVDFDEAMNAGFYEHARQKTMDDVGVPGNILFHFLRGLYNKNNLSAIRPSKQERIAKVVHCIMLDASISGTVEATRATWMARHGPAWQFRIWTAEDLTRDGLCTASWYQHLDDPQTRADCAKIEIAYRHGGVCIDAGVMCLRPFDILNYTYDLCVGIEPLEGLGWQLGLSVLAARAGHPVLEHCLKELEKDLPSDSSPKPFVCRRAFTRAFYAVAQIHKTTDIALPVGYFCLPTSTSASADNGQTFATKIS